MSRGPAIPLDPPAARRPEAPAAAARRLGLSGAQWWLADADGPDLARLPLAQLRADAPASDWPPGWQLAKRGAGRAVWSGSLDGRPVFLKVVRERGWTGRLAAVLRGTRASREWEASLFAWRRRLAVARPLAYSPSVAVGGRTGALLLYEAVSAAQPLDQAWLERSADSVGPSAGRAARRALLEALAETVARAHQSGLEHVDLHPMNVLVQAQPGGSARAVLIDLAGARCGPVDQAAAVRNLAQLNQWFRRHAPLPARLRFLRAYLRWRQEYEGLDDARPTPAMPSWVGALEEEAATHARRLWGQRDRRALRGGKYFATLRAGAWRGVVYQQTRHPRSWSPASQATLPAEWWRSRLARPLRLLGPDGALLKESHSASVARAVLVGDGHRVEVLVKRPLSRNWRRWLRNLLAPSRSRRAWSRGNALLHRAVPAARPLALLERRLGPLVLDSLVLTEWVPAALDLEAHLRREYATRSPVAWRRHRRQLAPRLARQLRGLFAAECAHRDCKAQNLLVHVDRSLELIWIDMDGVCPRRRAITTAQQAEALARLHVSLLPLPGLTRSDRVRFLRAFATRWGAPRGAWRDWWRAVAPRVERKQLRLAERQAWKLRHYGRT